MSSIGFDMLPTEIVASIVEVGNVLEIVRVSSLVSHGWNDICKHLLEKNNRELERKVLLKLCPFIKDMPIPLLEALGGGRKFITFTRLENHVWLPSLAHYDISPSISYGKDAYDRPYVVLPTVHNDDQKVRRLEIFFDDTVKWRYLGFPYNRDITLDRVGDIDFEMVSKLARGESCVFSDGSVCLSLIQSGV